MWGRRWWIAGEAEPREFGLADAAEALAGHFAGEPKPVRLRLLYQPEGFVSARAVCPPGKRTTLTLALAGEFPALADPANAWSHEPVMPEGEAHSTILHFEPQPGLFGLARKLADLGLAVDSAWPLLTFLQAVPDEWTDSGAITILAVQAGSAAAYRHPKDGGREARTWHGESAVREAGEWLTGLLREDPSEPVLLVPADEPVAREMAARVPAENHPAVEIMPLAEVLRHRVVLPRYHPAHLLPPAPPFSAQRLAIAASIALFLSVGGIGWAFARDWIEVKAQSEARITQLETLQRDVARLRGNAVEIARLRRELAGPRPGPPCTELLARLAATVPAEIVLDTVRLTDDSFRVSGWQAPGVPPALLEEWRGRFAAGAPWTAAAQTGPGGGFSLGGEFRR